MILISFLTSLTIFLHRRISFDGKERTDSVIPLEGLQGAIALDWHNVHPGYIYWSDVDTDTISRAEWDGRNARVSGCKNFHLNCCYDIGRRFERKTT